MKFTSLVLFTIISKVFAVEKTEAGAAVSQDNKDKNVSEKNRLPSVPENLNPNEKQEGSTDEDNGTASTVNEQVKDPKDGLDKNGSKLLDGGQPEKSTEKQDASTTASAPAAPADNKEANKTEEEKAQAEQKAKDDAKKKADEEKAQAEKEAKEKAEKEEKEKAEANKNNNTAGTGSPDPNNSEKSTDPKEGLATSTKTTPAESSNPENAPTDPKSTGNDKPVPSTTETAPAAGVAPSSGDKPNKDSTGEEKEKKSTDWKKYLLWGTLGVCVVGFIVVIALMASK